MGQIGRGACPLLLAGCLAAAAGAGTADGQTAAPSGGGAEPVVPEKLGKELRAFRIRGEPPRIDGRLDDEVWGAAPSIEDFVQDDPDNMQPATERTIVQIAYDDRYLYIAAHLNSRNGSDVRTGLGRRDNFPPSDLIAFAFDPRHDHLTSYMFRVNASGVQSDLTYFDDTNSNSDYDGVWESATQVTSQGWDAEFRIPFSQMRFAVPPGERAVWGFQVRREIAGRGEIDNWVPRPRGQQGQVSRYGHLIFDDRLTPPRRLEFLPFTLGRYETDSDGPSKKSIEAGLDMRMGLGTSSTISATLTPDFGQVEADPAVLNLSIFETFFPEKRAFFLEDSRVFVLPYGQIPDFYSRRIGQTPGWFELASNEELVSKPANTTILGAAKFTGKASSWTYGALAALTDREHAIVDVTEQTADGRDVVRRVDRLIEPMTTYSVGRVQRDVLRGSSNIGAIATAVVREGDHDAFTGGPDFNIRWSSNRYRLSGHWLGTRAPISGVVEDGFGGVTNFSYSGKYLGVDGHYDHISPTFRNSDLGFLGSRVNKNEYNGGFNLNRPDPWKAFRNMNIFVNTARQWNDEGLVFGKWIGIGTNLSFRNFWNVYFNVFHNPPKLDDLDSRGGPPIVKPVNTNMNFGFGTDSRKRWNVFNNFTIEREGEGGWRVFAATNLRMQPSGRLQTSLSASYNNGVDVAQWIENSDVDGDGTTDYVYGRLRRHVLNITGRATYAFSRDMTLEAFLQPFVAVGDYVSIGKLARPSSFEFTPVSPTDDPDFNRKSLRGTVVMRWEYIRGSTLFVVWNLSASDTSRPGVFSPGRDLAGAFGAPGSHAFAVKINYWITP
jgi:hypothetical protein